MRCRSRGRRVRVDQGCGVALSLGDFRGVFPAAVPDRVQLGAAVPDRGGGGLRWLAGWGDELELSVRAP